MSWSALNDYAKRFGAQTFGVITLILLYVMVFRPIIQEKTASLEKFNEISTTLDRAANSLKDATAAQARIAEAQASTARVLEKAVDRLEHMYDVRTRREP